jgi:hypothetical protein
VALREGLLGLKTAGTVTTQHWPSRWLRLDSGFEIRTAGLKAAGTPGQHSFIAKGQKRSILSQNLMNLLKEAGLKRNFSALRGSSGNFRRMKCVHFSA